MRDEDYTGWINVSDLKGRSVTEKIKVAASIVSAISDMHCSGMITLPLAPDLLLVDAATLKRCVITGIPAGDSSPSSGKSADGTGMVNSILYAPPEILRGAVAGDARSDLYSAGVLLYELFTGNPPFVSDSADEIIHSHIAVIPAPPSSVDASVPSSVSDIVMRLLAKDPDERYGSAGELLRDIEMCGDGTAAAPPVSVKHGGYTGIAPQITGKLYGRGRELALCGEAYGRAADREAVLLLVSGEAGVGKTALVKGMIETASGGGAFCGYGKFNTGAGEIPYSAVAEAFTAMVRRILTDSDIKLESMKARFRETLHPNCAIITALIPEFELLVGRESAPATSGPVEIKSRFLIWFSRFVEVMAEHGNPAVLFLDDIQWGDSASLELVNYLVFDSDIKKLLVICAYREGEDYQCGPHRGFVDRAAGRDGVTHIRLSGLDENSIIEMVRDSLESARNGYAELGGQIFRKTAGVPFFAMEYLKEAFARGAITESGGAWMWERERLESIPASDGLAEILSNSMKHLQADMRSVLSACTCAGWSFSVELIASVLRSGEDKTRILIDGLCGMGYIIHDGESYRFTHDRVRETAYRLIPETERRKLHWRTGRVLYGMAADDEELFRAVEQMNLGRELINSDKERIELAQLNLEAGVKAKGEAAFASALVYLQTAYELLTENSWVSNYDLTCSVYRELSEVQYIEGNYNNSEELINTALENVSTDFERAEFHLIRIIKYYIMAMNHEGVEEGKKALKLFNIDVPESGLDEHIQKEIEKIDSFIEKNGMISISLLPETTDPVIILMLKILNKMAVTAFYSSFNMLCFSCLKAATLSIDKGIYFETAPAFSGYGNILIIMGKYKKAYEFIKTAYRISERFNDYAVRCAVHNHMANQGMFWFTHLRESEEVNRDGLKYGIISGEMIYAGMITSHMMTNAFHGSVHLGEILIRIEEHIAFNLKTRNVLSLDIQLGLKRVLLNLTGKTSGYQSFEMENNTEDQYIETCLIHRNEIMIHQYYIFKLQTLYLYKFFRESLELIKSFENKIGALSVTYSYTELIFYYSLTLAALIPDADEDTKQEYFEKIKANQEKMKEWAGNCKENFLHKYLLVEAELAALNGDITSAIDLYAKSIESAAEHGYIQNEAIANERTGRFWLSKGRSDFAMLHLERARSGYEKWGASRKVALLLDEFPALKTGAAKTETHASSADPDNFALVKSLQAISGEIKLGRLMHTLMRNMLQYEGGTRIVLLLEKRLGLFLEAEGYVDQLSGRIESVLHQSVPIEECPDLPVRLLRYCSRSGSTIIINDVLSGDLPVESNYLRRGMARSVLCVRSSSGTTAVVVYVENSLTKNAFTQQRVETLKLLAVQAAISIENARLYREKEDSARRLSELGESRERLLRQYEEARHRAMIERTNPHFLYNAIHTIHALIKMDPAEADRGTLMLAEIMRFLTDRSFEQLVPLEDEMRFVELYLSFEKIRFPETVSYSIKTEGDIVNITVPPLTVQPLVENAIKHGLRRKPGGGTIDINVSAIDGTVRIDVMDTGVGLQGGDFYSRTLGNIRDRLRYYFSGAELLLDNGGNGGAAASIIFSMAGGINEG